MVPKPSIFLSKAGTCIALIVPEEARNGKVSATPCPVSMPGTKGGGCQSGSKEQFGMERMHSTHAPRDALITGIRPQTSGSEKEHRVHTSDDAYSFSSLNW